MPNGTQSTLTINDLRTLYLNTELGGNQSAINIFSYAGTGTSAYSFGLPQFDVGSNSAAAQFLSNNGFTSAQISELKQQGGLSQSQLTSLNAQLQQIPAATLDQFTDAYLTKNLDTLNQILGDLSTTNPTVASQIANSKDLQLAVLDYNNQFGISGVSSSTAPSNGMLAYLEGSAVTLPGGTLQLANNGTSISNSSIQDFISATKYGQANPSAVSNRYDQLVNTQQQVDASQDYTSDSANSLYTNSLIATSAGLDGDLTCSIDDSGTVAIVGSNGSVGLLQNGSLNINASNSSFSILQNVVVNIQGAGNTLQCGKNDTINAAANDTGETLTGSGFILNGSAGLFSGTVTGSNDVFNLAPSSNSSLTCSGTNNAIFSTGNSLSLFGANSTASVTGVNTIDMDSADQSLTLASNGNTVNVAANDTGDVINGSSVSINAGTDAFVNAFGSNDTVLASKGDGIGVTGGGNTIDAGSDELVWVNGTGGRADTIVGSDIANGITMANGQESGIWVANNAQVNVQGSSDTIAGAAGDSIGVTGSFNTIDAGSDQLVWINGTNGNADAVIGSDIAIGDTVANGQDSGIWVANNAQVNVQGSSDTIIGTTGDSIGVTGGFNTIDAGSDELVWVNGTNGNADTVVGSDIAIGDTMANGQDSGIWVANNAQVNVQGSSDTIIGTTGDSIGVTGGFNTIDAGSDELVWVNGTDGNADTVVGSDITTGDTLANGQESGIWVANNAQANVQGSSDTIIGTTGDSIGVTGGSNTIDAGSDELVWINGTDGKADTVVGSDIATGDTLANGQDSGIWVANNAQANVQGSSDTIIGTTGDSIGVTGGSDTIDAGSDELVWINGTDGNADTVVGSNIANGDTMANGQDSGIWVANNAQVDINGSGNAIGMGSGDVLSLNSGDKNDFLSGSDDTLHADSQDDFTVNGSYDTVTGSDDQISLSGQGDVIDISHATIDVSGDDGVTIDGSDDKIVGGNGDSFTITGTDDTVDASDSSVTFDGSNTGDYVSGSGDTGSNWDDPTGSGGYSDPGAGYYGYGLTKWKNQDPSAAQIAKAEHSDSVYEGAKWADKTITWSFASAGNGYSDAITNTAEQTAIEQAFQSWAKASGLNFDEVAAGSKADIEVGFSDLNPAGTNEIGLTRYWSQAGALTGAKVELEDPTQAALTTDANGQVAYANTDATFEQVALHEIGHALGLADTDVPGSIMNAVLGVDNQAPNTGDTSNVQKLYATGSSGSSSASLSQVHQLVQAMSVFDAGELGTDINPMTELYLQKEHLLAGSLVDHVRAL